MDSPPTAPPQPSAHPPLHVAVAGVGAFGRNHLRVYHDLAAQGVVLSAIIETDPAAAVALRADSPTAIYSSVEACLEARRAGEVRIDAVSICVPTSAHYHVAAAMMAEGIDILVEKPIATNLEQADALIALAKSSNRVLQIGHLERFNPAVLAIQPYLNNPMFFEAHRLSIFTPRSLDVDVVLDLMVHDLDIVLSIARSPIRDLRAVGLPILSSKVDIANVRIEFDSGCVANFTASRVSTERVRKLRFFQPRQYVSIDYARKDLLVIDVAAAIHTAAGAASKAPGSASLPTHANGTPEQHQPASPSGLSFSKPEVLPGEPLRLEIESFLQCVRSRSAPKVNGSDGRAALALALQIHEAMATHSKRAGLERFHL